MLNFPIETTERHISLGADTARARHPLTFLIKQMLDPGTNNNDLGSVSTIAYLRSDATFVHGRKAPTIQIVHTFAYISHDMKRSKTTNLWTASNRRSRKMHSTRRDIKQNRIRKREILSEDGDDCNNRPAQNNGAHGIFKKSHKESH